MLKKGDKVKIVLDNVKTHFSNGEYVTFAKKYGDLVFSVCKIVTKRSGEVVQGYHLHNSDEDVCDYILKMPRLKEELDGKVCIFFLKEEIKPLGDKLYRRRKSNV